MFAVETYRDRRGRLRTSLADAGGLVLLLGNEEAPMNYRDNTYPFRQDSNFLYYCGLDQPGMALLLDLDEGTETLFGHDLSLDDIVWTGPLPTLAERGATSGLSMTRPAADLEDLVRLARDAGRRVHWLPPYRGENVIKLRDWLGLSTAEATSDASVDLIKAIVAMRSIKSDEEITEIEKAVDLSSDMHLRVMEMARPGMSEHVLAAAAEEQALRGGGHASFPIILSVHGEILHNHSHENILESGQLCLLDCGATSPRHYAGDLSSTFPVDPTFTTRQREVYDVAVASHRAAVETLAPGTPNLEVHLAAARAITSGLKDLGLMKGDIEEAVAAGAHAAFLPCGVGHMMGLDVHDMEDLGEQYVGYGDRTRSTAFGLKSLRLARELEPGFVLTVEPGIYFIPELIDRWSAEGKFDDFIAWGKVKEYRDFGGIRNEEDWLITADGARKLGKDIPLTADEVEAIRRG